MRPGEIAHYDSSGSVLEHKTSSFSLVSDHSVSELPWSEDWEDALKLTLFDLHASVDPQPGGNTRVALITDALGVEVRALQDKAAARPLSPGRFPLRIRCHAPIAKASSPKSVASNTGPNRSSPFSSVDTKRAEESTLRNVAQVSEPIEFADVWPGIIDVKLAREGCNDTSFLVVTDKTGVEVDLASHRDTVPPSDRFPLRLHFRTKTTSGPQTVAQEVTSQLSAPRLSLNMGRSSSQGSSARPSTSSSVSFVEHSVALAIDEILPGVVDEKLRRNGLTLDPQHRPMALITDCIGVVVKPADVPSRSRFPLKVHVETSVLLSLEPEVQPNSWFWDSGSRRKSSFRSDSDLSAGMRTTSGGLATTISCRLQGARRQMKQAVNQFRSTRA